jgi:hypothetical protein
MDNDLLFPSARQRSAAIGVMSGVMAANDRFRDMGIPDRANRERLETTQLSRSRRVSRTAGVGHDPPLWSVAAVRQAGSRPAGHALSGKTAVSSWRSSTRRWVTHSNPFSTQRKSVVGFNIDLGQRRC